MSDIHIMYWCIIGALLFIYAYHVFKLERVRAIEASEYLQTLNEAQATLNQLRHELDVLHTMREGMTERYVQLEGYVDLQIEVRELSRKDKLTEQDLIRLHEIETELGRRHG